jgi:hypothetical protein
LCLVNSWNPRSLERSPKGRAEISSARLWLWRKYLALRLLSKTRTYTTDRYYVSSYGTLLTRKLVS